MSDPAEPAAPRPARRRATSTSAFGVGKRESHDASDFYARFTPPRLDPREDVQVSEVPEPCVQDDSRRVGQYLEPDSVALVVTSPPYFAGKEYEQALGEGVIPESYAAYLKMLEEVFAACVEVLEPGGRIAVNVANLGRRPYRSLSADVTAIFERLGLLLRGEVIWRKAEGATGSCAWGSFRSPKNPVLRDLTERVVIASKGRFDRALDPAERAQRNLPSEGTLSSDEFMAATMDLWEIAPESARRVGHPAPFPVELPRRLIELYTYRGDLVLDPFMGAGSTLVAALRAGRQGIGFDTDPGYIELTRKRLAEERARLAEGPEDPDEAAYAAAVASGKMATARAQALLEACGFEVLGTKRRVRGAGIQFDLEVQDATGGRWYVDVPGGYTVTRPGLRRPAEVLPVLGKAHVWRGLRGPEDPRLLLLAPFVPSKGPARRLLRAVGPEGLFDVLALDAPDTPARLQRYASEGAAGGPVPGFWTLAEIAPKT